MTKTSKVAKATEAAKAPKGKEGGRKTEDSRCMERLGIVSWVLLLETRNLQLETCNLHLIADGLMAGGRDCNSSGREVRALKIRSSGV